VTEHEGTCSTIKEEHVQLRALSNLMVYRMGQACLRLCRTLPFACLPELCAGKTWRLHKMLLHMMSVQYEEL